MAIALKHMLGIEGMKRDEILSILEQSAAFKEVMRRPIKKVPTLRGKLVINLFYESSTRTRSSFEIAEKILSADALNWAVSGSAVSKGETFLDTAKNLEAMRPDVIIIRHGVSGTPHYLANNVRCAVINAGDGAHEHPSQALLDAFTLQERLGDLAGKKIAIVGDIAHSRVARSNFYCLKALGAEVRACAPPTLLPNAMEQYGIMATTSLQRALDGVDAVMLLRIQSERLTDPLFPGAREYARYWGLNQDNLKYLPEHALVMHPGPINRGVELAPEIADGPRSVILDQVENGVAVRMALLYMVCGCPE